MRGRKTIRSPELEKRFFDAIKAGNTHKAAAHYAGFSQETLYQWIKTFPEFAESLTRAESECEVHYVASLKKAGTGYERTEVKTTKKIAYRERVIKHPDGSVEEIREPVPFEEVTTTTSEEFDWRAGVEWLKRRRKEDWTDKLPAEVGNDDPLPGAPAGRIVYADAVVEVAVRANRTLSGKKLTDPEPTEENPDA